MTAVLSPAPVFQGLLPNGQPNAGGLLYTYAAGTTTPQATYVDSTQTTPNTNPVVLNSQGQANVWLNPTLVYKFVLQDANGNQLYAVDQIAGVTQSVIAQLLFPQTPAEAAAGVTPTNYAYPAYTPPRYGADPTGVIDSTAAINTCTSIGSPEVDFMGGTYRISASTHAALTGIFGANSVCLQPRSNQRWRCTGAVFNLAGGYSASSGAMVGNWTGAALSNWECIGGTWNGNKAGVTGTCSSIQTVDSTNCHMRECYSLNSSYLGFAIRLNAGVAYNANYGSYQCSITHCVVSASANIGIQVSRCAAMLVMANQVYNAGNNGIDSDGNNAGGDPGWGIANKICDNIIQGVTSAGIFIESSTDYQITGNRISNSGGAGIYLNRINSGAKNIQIVGNKLSQATQGSYGIDLNNNVGVCQISDNLFDNYISSIYLNLGTEVNIGQNHHRNVQRYCVEFPTTTNAVTFSYIAKQVLEDTAQASGGLPYLHPPINCPSNSPSRGYLLQSEGLVSLTPGTTSLPNYQIGYVQLATPFSAFVSSKTQVTFVAPGNSIAPGVTADTIAVGDYLLLAGTAYNVGSLISANVYTVQQWNGSAYVDGNFTAALNYGIFGNHYNAFWASN